jgi:four helix bundle protein
MENFWKLQVVRFAHKLVLEIYLLTKNFPDSERFGLISQMRRAAVSVVANLIEATKRRSSKDKKNFHNISNGSLEELKYYLVLSTELKYIKIEKGKSLNELCRKIGAMITGLNKSLK